GEVPTFLDGDGLTWIRGRAEWAPKISFRQLEDPGQVEALTGAPDGLGFVDCWAWEDEAAGRIRARVFAARFGIAEDEATGAAAVRLGSRLGRPGGMRGGAGAGGGGGRAGRRGGPGGDDPPGRRVGAVRPPRPRGQRRGRGRGRPRPRPRPSRVSPRDTVIPRPRPRSRGPWPR